MISLVRVIPIARGISKETLTYFTSKRVATGALVDVLVRTKKIPALVVACETVTPSKAEIKSASFGLKKIEGVRHENVFLPAFVRAVLRASEYYAGTAGAVLHALVPDTVLLRARSLPPVAGGRTRKSEPRKGDAEPQPYEKQILQTGAEERRAAYKSIIREAFARGSSVAVCLPTVEETERFAGTLLRGIEPYTVVIHGALSAETQTERWKTAMRERHPLLLIGTGMILSVPRADIQTVIIEREGDDAYKSARRPFLDTRTFAEFFVEEIGGKIIFGDELTRTETLFRHERGELVPAAPVKFRALSQAEQTLVTMRAAKDEHGSAEFRILSDEALLLIAHAEAENRHALLFGARRGLYPLTVCGDCGAVAVCARCAAPVVLHKTAAEPKRGGNLFVCHSCGATRRPDDRCASCGSWRVTPLGIGTERIEEAARAAAPGMPVLQLDSGTATTKKKARDIAARFAAAPRALLVATSMAIPYLAEEVAYTIVVSLDATFTLPDFRINERVFRILLALRALTTKHFMVQTRMENISLFTHVLRGNVMNFYREELAQREKLRYPPFVNLIKITRSGSEAAVQSDMARLADDLAGYDCATYPAFIARIKGKHVMHALLRIPRGAWPDKELLARLRKLPPSYAIEVDPPSIL